MSAGEQDDPEARRRIDEMKRKMINAELEKKSGKLLGWHYVAFIFGIIAIIGGIASGNGPAAFLGGIAVAFPILRKLKIR